VLSSHWPLFSFGLGTNSFFFIMRFLSLFFFFFSPFVTGVSFWIGVDVYPYYALGFTRTIPVRNTSAYIDGRPHSERGNYAYKQASFKFSFTDFYFWNIITVNIDCGFSQKKDNIIQSAFGLKRKRNNLYTRQSTFSIDNR